MGQADETSAMPVTATQSGISRKLLTRKALEKVDSPKGEPLETCFPPAVSDAQKESVTASSASFGAPTALPAQSSSAPLLWSSQQEAAFQTLLASRKAAGYQRRGKDVGGQVIRPGAIKPNEGTVAAVIVGILAHAGTMNRGAIVDAMATANFLHPKARPTDRGWCQGYVAGAIRSGFLVAAELSATLAGEPSATLSEASANQAESSANAGEA